MHFVKALLVGGILGLAPSWSRADDMIVSANGKSCLQVCKVSNRHAVPVASIGCYREVYVCLFADAAAGSGGTRLLAGWQGVDFMGCEGANPDSTRVGECTFGSTARANFYCLCLDKSIESLANGD
jgi:hypothetical protein